MKHYDTTLLKKTLEELGIVLEEKQLEQFLSYYELLITWNGFMNLTGITEFSEVCIKHFLDSLTLCKVLDCKRELSLIDVGTGAGFPGIPLKIVYPQLKITLLDSLGKRVKFLQEVIDSLGLTGIEAIHGRAEDFAKPGVMREQFDVCVSRAVANLSTLSEYCLPFVKKGGVFIPYKSEKLEEESRTASHAISVLGGRISKQESFYLPQSDIYRVLLLIEKEKPTPKQYPRKAGLPSKEPL